MTTIQLMACIGMVVGFFVLLGITPRILPRVFRQITSKPKSLRDEINESTQRKKNLFCAGRSRRAKIFFV